MHALRRGLSDASIATDLHAHTEQQFKQQRAARLPTSDTWVLSQGVTRGSRCDWQMLGVHATGCPIAPSCRSPVLSPHPVAAPSCRPILSQPRPVAPSCRSPVPSPPPVAAAAHHPSRPIARLAVSHRQMSLNPKPSAPPEKPSAPITWAWWQVSPRNPRKNSPMRRSPGPGGRCPCPPPPQPQKNSRLRQTPGPADSG
eukprot:364478-Chlamydomonas_euryale.AAC.11